ncbi:MAG TPA: TlpA disulfide reductase family protein [Terracidiphilus sp.]|jgi:peroxiredoxin|nr:TlpA disulfide reductase family protein [Terracidiphilus sp.]
MPLRRVSTLAFALLFAVTLLHAEVKPSHIEDQIRNLRSVSSDQKPAAIQKLAEDIRTLPAGSQKVSLADTLLHLSTEGDMGKPALQAVADTLSAALTESPVPAKGDKVPMPYYDLAKLVRYEGVTATVTDPLYAKSMQMLADNEADIQKANFTLRDLKGNKVTLSELRGKIVLVNFWATWCGPCRLEMSSLDGLYRYFQPQGLVVLSVTDEELFKVGSFLAPYKYTPPVLLDPGGKVHQQFHITGIPNTFLFGRDGKLLAVAIDQRSQKQFLAMLSKTDLHP